MSGNHSIYMQYLFLKLKEEEEEEEEEGGGEEENNFRSNTCYKESQSKISLTFLVEAF